MKTKSFFYILSILFVSCNLIACNNSKINNNETNIEKTETTPTPTITSEVTPTNVGNDNENVEIKSEITPTLENPWNGVDITKYQNSGYDNIQALLPNELYDKMENNETFLLYLGKENCKWCKIVLPLLAEANMQDIKVYSINTGYFNENYPKDTEDPIYKEVLNQHNQLQEIVQYKSVPCFRYIENGNLEYGMANPLSSGYFAEDATSATKEEEKNKCLNKINDLFLLLKNGKTGIPQEKLLEWEEYKIGLTKKEEDTKEEKVLEIEVKQEETFNVLSASQMSTQEIWDLEKEYGMRLVPDGEVSYWDTINELPPNE